MSTERLRAERDARLIIDQARKEAAALLAQAREAADAVLADAKDLSDMLQAASARLRAEADQLVRDVQQTHRELLAELRVPGLAQREPRPGADEIFERPDWSGRD